MSEPQLAPAGKALDVFCHGSIADPHGIEWPLDGRNFAINVSVRVVRFLRRITGVIQVRNGATQIDYGRYYRRYHDESDRHFEIARGWSTAKLAPLLPPERSAPILEVGCGMGFALAAMQQLGYSEVEGIDADEGQIAAARRRALPALHVPVENSAAFLAERTEHYAAIVCIDVLEHVPVADQLGFMRGVHGALRPGGRLICQVPNANAGIASRFRYHDWTHYCSFTEASLDFVLYNAGFADIAVAEVDPPRRPRYPFIPRRSVMRWLLRAGFRAVRRLQYAVELGPEEAASIPLTPNIIAVATRPGAAQLGTEPVHRSACESR